MRSTERLRTVLQLVMMIPAMATAAGEAPLQEPHCQPRSHVAPGRLNIDSDTQGYGFEKPCQSFLHFYIARNTPLRSIDAAISLYDASAKPVRKARIRVDFENNQYGMLSKKYAIAPVDGYRCWDLIVNVDELICLGENEKIIECPAVRLKQTYSFAALTINGRALDLCYDD